MRLWGTPSVADVDGGRMHRSGTRSNELLLKGQAVQLTESWATPTARDHRSILARPHTRNRNSRPLSEQVGGFCSRRGRPTSDGVSSCQPRSVRPGRMESLGPQPDVGTVLADIDPLHEQLHETRRSGAAIQLI